MGYAIHVSKLSKSFGRGQKALDAIDFTVQPGEMVALLGASGSGKSTLLRHLAGLVEGDADGNRVYVNGALIQANGRYAPGVRQARQQIGFLAQQFNLVGRLPVITNVLMGILPTMPSWRSLCKFFVRSEIHLGLDILTRIGMAEHAFKRASLLSGGQQQRVAIARTLAQNARVILADEPIASLDPESARKVMETLWEINRTSGVTVLVSLHQVDVAFKYCTRVVALRNGRMVYDGAADKLSTAMLQDLYGAQIDELQLLGHAANLPAAPHDPWPTPSAA